MHRGELDINEALVRRLLGGQFPDLADLDLQRVPSSGTVNILYRLGPDLMIRLPRLADFGNGPLREAEWLPRLAPNLPLAIPPLVALGSPTDDYPVHWSVVEWIDGENATPATLDDLGEAAAALGEFVVSLRAIDTSGAPTGNYRGWGLFGRDTLTRRAIADVTGEFDSAQLTAAWDQALSAPLWSGPETWFHGDLHSGNLLARDGKLHAVIDFEGTGAGDPSSDLIAAWWLFDASSRGVFRDAIGADEGEWSRGRGWALSIALIALPYYVDTNPQFADMARAAIRQVLAEG